MCKSIADGGQRCAAHTRVAYERACGNYRAGEPGAVEQRAKAGVEYASTTEGQSYFLDEAKTASARLDFEEEVRCKSLAARGESMRAANTESAAAILDAAARAANAANPTGPQVIPPHDQPITTWDDLQARPSTTDVDRVNRKVTTTWVLDDTVDENGDSHQTLIELVTRHSPEGKRFATLFGTQTRTREVGATYTVSAYDPMADYTSVNRTPAGRYSLPNLAAQHEQITAEVRDYLTPGSAGYTTTANEKITNVLARAATPKGSD